MFKRILIFFLAFSIAAAVGAAVYIYIPRAVNNIYKNYISPVLEFHAGLLDFSFGFGDEAEKAGDSATSGEDPGDGTGRGNLENEGDGKTGRSGTLNDQGGGDSSTDRSGVDGIGDSENTDGEGESGEGGSDGSTKSGSLPEGESPDGADTEIGSPVGEESNKGLDNSGTGGRGGNSEAEPVFSETDTEAEEVLRDKIVEAVATFVKKGGFTADKTLLERLTMEDRMNAVKIFQSIDQKDREEISRLM